jgi:hypothetical protein
LRRLCPELPSAGIVAGQSVASLILHRLGRPGPIHDIDVFLVRPMERTWTEERRSAPRMVYTEVGGTDVDMPCGYGDALVHSHRAFRARFGQVTREGLLNLIEYEIEHDGGSDVLSLIAGHFDLNCVQVGIDLATERLCFTDAFRDYLNRQQLILVNGNTPVASLARLARKAGELGAYCDLETEGRFAAACALLFGAGNGESQAADFVGEIGYAKIEPHLGAIERWMRLAPVSAFPADGRRDRLDDGLYDPLDGVGVTWSAKAFRLYRACVDAEVERSLLANPSSCGAIRIEGREGRWMAMLGDRPLTLLEFSVIDRLFRKEELSRRKLKKLQSVFEHGRHGVLVSCLAAPLLYIRDNVTADSVKEINGFFEGYPAVAPNLVGMSHEEQLRIVRALRGYQRRGKRWVVGAVESAHVWLGEPVGPALVRDGLDALIQRYIQHEARFIEGSTPRGLERLPLFEIRQLRTAEERLEDCDAMGHYVGGYAAFASRHRSYIFSIRFELGAGAARRSTLVVEEGERGWVIEHRGTGFAPPGLANRVAAGVLLERLTAARDGRRAEAWRVATAQLYEEARSHVRRGLGRGGMRTWRPDDGSVGGGL